MVPLAQEMTPNVLPKIVHSQKAHCFPFVDSNMSHGPSLGKHTTDLLVVALWWLFGLTYLLFRGTALNEYLMLLQWLIGHVDCVLSCVNTDLRLYQTMLVKYSYMVKHPGRIHGNRHLNTASFNTIDGEITYRDGTQLRVTNSNLSTTSKQKHIVISRDAPIV